MLTNAVEPDQLGGLYRYVSRLSAALVTAGAEVEIVTKRPRPELPERERRSDGVLVTRYAVPPKSNPLFAGLYPAMAVAGVVRALRARDGLVHAHYPLPALAPRLLGRPYLHTFHAPVYRELLPERAGSYLLPALAQGAAVRGTRALERTAISGARRLVVLSEHSRREAGLISPMAGTRALSLPGGVDLECFSPGPPIADPWVGDAEPLLFAARRLNFATGVLELVEAMKAVQAQLPRARLAIAGSGAAEQAVRERVHALGLSGSVRLLGPLPESVLAGWYRAAGLVVVPSQQLEAFGLATVEGLACGAAVVATPVGGSPELLEPLDRRLLSLSPRPESLAEAIVRLWRDPALLESIRSRARSRVAPQMGWRYVAERYLAAYAELQED